MKPLLIFVCITVLFYACKKKECCNDASNPNCENYDPCFNSLFPNADFVIEEMVHGRYFEGDSIGDNLVRFRALYDADSFYWELGSEKIRTKEFSRKNFPQNSWINVKLVVFKKDVHHCHRAKSEFDTLSSSFYSWDFSVDSNFQFKYPLTIEGNYSGYYESNPNQKFDITLGDTIFRNLSGQLDLIYRIKGFPYPNTDTYESKFTELTREKGVFSTYVYSNQRYYKYGSTNIICVPEFNCFAWLDRKNRNKLYLDINYKDTLSGVWKNMKFSGLRK
jgi:hypothetical protein